MTTPSESDQLSNIIIIDALPVVSAEKFGKLQTLVNKICNSFGCQVQRCELVRGENGATKGYAFVEYGTKEEAERAIYKLNNHRLDAKHIFAVCSFDTWLEVRDVPDTYQEPEAEAHQPEENMLGWLLDPGAREQYLVLHDQTTEVWWNDPLVLDKQVLAESRKTWTEGFLRWSPLGTYLATVHEKGVQLWGGSDFKSLGRFTHKDVKLIDFSPKEKFLVTWYNRILVFDVKTKAFLRQFPGGPTPEHGWPVFKWSHNEQYFARIQEDNIHIFDSSTMKLVQPDPNKATTLYIPQVRAFEWSPTENILSYWIPEQGDKPARVVLLQLVGGQSVRFEQLAQKNLFRVVDIKMHWQSQGDFLCVKVDRYSKTSTSKDKVTNFELFRMKQRPIAVDVVELTEQVIAFAWEPNGVRFAVIYGNNPQKYCVSFYTMGGHKTGQVKLLKSMPKKQANFIFWSPRGTHLVIAGMESCNPAMLEFWNVDDLERAQGGGEHFMCHEVQWDPSGRYVASSVSCWRHQMENGYILWTFQGKEFKRCNRDKLYQFQWRPRPPSLLDDKRLKTIQKQLTQRVAKFQQEDMKFEHLEEENLKRERREKTDAFAKFLKDARESLKQQTQTRRKQRRCDYNSDDETCYHVIQTTVEEIVEETLEEMG